MKGFLFLPSIGYRRIVLTLALFLFFNPALHAQGPEILKDIWGHTTNHSQNDAGYNYFGYNGSVYFSANDVVHGFELWKSDGTEAGTVLLKDINPGTGNSNPTNFVVLNGVLLFGASSPLGFELWKTDGTEAGTVIVKDIYTGAGNGNVNNFLVIGNTMYFTASTNTQGTELWKTDGTEAGTVLVKDIQPGFTSSVPLNFKELNGILYFSATTSANGRELWRSDGTEAGTLMVTDIYAGTANSSPANLTTLGNNLYFTASHPTYGSEIWKTDGTEAGTMILKDITGGTGSTSIYQMLTFNSQLIFVANDQNTGIEVWKSDGTEPGTEILKDIYPGSASSSPTLFTQVGNQLFFRANDPSAGNELWKTDGTSAGTVLVKDIYPGSSSGPDRLINVNGILFFRAYTISNGVELYRSDGTEAGTYMVKDISTLGQYSSPENLVAMNGTLYFSAYIDSDIFLMKSDGTEAGTVVVSPTNAKSGLYAGLYPYGNKLFFMHRPYEPATQAEATGNEPWVSDGTDAGTHLLKDVNNTTSGSGPGPFIKYGNHVYFKATETTTGSELWRTDGTEAGTVLFKDIRPGTQSGQPLEFAIFNNLLYFTANDGTHGMELWKTDGTDSGTVLFKDINAGSSSSQPTKYRAGDNILYFTAQTNSEGWELWKSDGTEAGTQLVKDLTPGSPSSSFIETKMTTLNDLLIFSFTQAGFGEELWVSDGTDAGTYMLKDIRPGTVGSGPQHLTRYNGKVYFSANDGVSGNELWVTDGTPAGTQMLMDLSSGTGNSNPANFAALEGKLYFTCYTPGYQFELWVTDGTLVGTYMVKDVYPGSTGSVPDHFAAMNGYIYFGAGYPGIGRELWRTDGTDAGTTLVKDIIPGAIGSTPHDLVAVNNTLYFKATTPNGDIELFQSDGTEAGTILHDLYPGATSSVPEYLTAFNDMLIFAATDQIKNREPWKAVALQLPSNSFYISGDTSVCEGKVGSYSAENIIDDNITYHWSLPDGGGVLTTNDSTATVTWNNAGTYRVALHISNSGGATDDKYITVNVITGGVGPTQAPTIIAFGRTLTATNFPDGTYCQWYRNGTAIPGADEPSYYAAADGAYTARFVHICATGPASNEIVFADAAIEQTISFPAIADVQLYPGLYIKLQATSSSGLPVFYQKMSGPGFISNDTLHISGAGTLVGEIVIRASQPGNDIYSPAPVKQQLFRIFRGNQTLHFDSVANMIYGDPDYPLSASATSGLPVSFSIVAGNEYAYTHGSYGTKIRTTGVGTVTVRAVQQGNANYFSAPPVEHTFCIGVRNLANIVGDANPCQNTYRYTVKNIPGANFQWTLSSGGILTTDRDTAWVQWQTPGNHTLSVAANSGCDTILSLASVLDIVTSDNAPVAVTGMLPVHEAINQQLPLRLSWIPGTHTTLYDLFVWKSGDPQPATPFAVDIDDISFTIPFGAIDHNETYNWRIVSKNPCSQTAGPVQEFSVIPLPDLRVSDVQAPVVANSGQTITVSWKVTNVGPGSTLPTDNWKDGVFFAMDTVPFVYFNSNLDWNPTLWNNLSAGTRPLLVGSKVRPTQLASGESYTNSVDFTLPINYSFPVYVYVITDYGSYGIHKIRQVSVGNDTARLPTMMDIQLTPTPDLRVDSVFVPTTTFSGSTINVTYKVKNYGALTPPDGEWLDSVFISQSPLFDPNTAIPLKAPKYNGTYYPNARDLTINKSQQLETDSFYTKTVPAVIPNFVFGTWFVYVKTNARSTRPYIYEGALHENNLGQAQIEVYLTPTPKLTVSSLSVPVSQASTTQHINVNWKIKNEGFRDNIEANKAHYPTFSICQNCPPGTPPDANISCPTKSIIADSVDFGSSYWIDRVYLSTNPNGLDIPSSILVTWSHHGIPNSGLNIPDPITGSYISCPAIVDQNVNDRNVILPGSLFPKNQTITIPEDLQPGNYYVYVYTNPTKTVFEYPGTPQIRRSDMPIVISRPDVSTTGITAPANATGATVITIDYNLRNVGMGAVFNHPRKDRLFISNSPVFDGSAQAVGTVSHTENMPIGLDIPHSFSYNVPANMSGTKYFYVVSNFDSSFKETQYNNNISAAAPIQFTAAVPADYIVTQVLPMDTVFTLYPEKIMYSVLNSGSGASTGIWTDSLFISCNPVFSRANSYFVGKRKQSRSLPASGSYFDSITVNMDYAFTYNSCFPEAMYGNAYFYVIANADTGTYEGSAVNNNMGRSALKTIVNPLVDHVVKSVTGADIANVGSPYPMNWVLKNLGYHPGQPALYGNWYDAVYFSTDSIADPTDPLMTNIALNASMQHNKERTVNRNFTLQYLPGGEYYVYVHTNYLNHIAAEKNRNNNVNFIRDASGAAKKIQVIQLPPTSLSDLVTSIVSAPTSVAVGQPITVVYKVTNNGPGSTYPVTTHSHRLMLSSDFQVNAGDRFLSSRSMYNSVGPGESFFDTVTINLGSNTVPGNYVLISQTNYTSKIIETNLDNNLGFSVLEIYVPPASDLMVEDIVIPDTVTLGYTIDTARWVVGNTSAFDAKGVSKDGIYLSRSDLFDSTAVLMGIKDKEINMQPLQKDTISMAPMVTGVTEGDYNVFVKTDVLFNIPEDNEDNNLGMANKKVHVQVKELPMNVDEGNTLRYTNRYYKLVIPDSLYGSTIMVTLRTPDSLTMRNEMFIAGNYVPTAADYDYAFENFNYGNQQIVMTDVTDSLYYIMYRCMTPNPVLQEVTLRAVKLPFAILNVHSNSGANIGNVTVRLRGSLYSEGMTASLSNGSTTITASAVYYTNSTQVFATFNLQGQPLGVYDVRLTKPDMTVAEMINGFSIVPANNGGQITGGGMNTAPGNSNEPGCDPGAAGGLNAQLVEELIVPSQVLINRPIMIVINYSNPTNFDLPAPTRVLFSETGVKMAFTKEGVPTGSTSLHIEFSEPGGPPGIIRAGGSGTIIVHSKSPGFIPPTGYILFKLN